MFEQLIQLSLEETLAPALALLSSGLVLLEEQMRAVLS